jgi:hypothetical protein
MTIKINTLSVDDVKSGVFEFQLHPPISALKLLPC